MKVKQVRASPEPRGPKRSPQRSWRAKMIAGCDVALTALATYQAIEGAKPAAIIATGFVRVVRLVAAMPDKRDRN